MELGVLSGKKIEPETTLVVWDKVRFCPKAAYKVHRVETPALPLSAYVDQKAFKLFAADIGLLRRLAGVPGAVVVDESPLYRELKGAMTENYVLQELVCALGEISYYWTSGNTAEVDFVSQAGDRIIPLEVKSSANLRSRSLCVYREKISTGSGDGEGDCLQN